SGGSHAITAIARDAAGNQATSAAVTITVDNSSDTVIITSPNSNSKISGSVLLNVAVSASSGVAGVQYSVDDVNVGSAITAAPYSTLWNTNTVSRGSHTLKAVLRDKAGKQVTSAPVKVNVVSKKLSTTASDGSLAYALSDQGAEFLGTTDASAPM